jgi:vanillate O-demethylase monooxygenase subunit
MISIDTALEYFWHPVCTVAELADRAPRPLGVRLLGRELAVAQVGPDPAGSMPVTALADRCPHRSTRLSVGWVEGCGVRCAYHGWLWSPRGKCLEIPSMPDGPIPGRAVVDAYEARVVYDLVWVRIRPGLDVAIPPNPAWEDDSMRVLPGAPYTWRTAAARRVENFVDLAHFAWVHDGTLGRRDQPVPPLSTVWRESGELRFGFVPPDMETTHEALFGWSRYRMPMPLTVDIEFRLADGARRRLWMTASPVDAGSCRTFWFVSRDDDLDGDDSAHLAFQALVLSEDEPVVCNQTPPELDLSVGAELSVRTDRVSVEYRRWLRELASAAEVDEPAEALGRVLVHDSRSGPPPSSSRRSASVSRPQPVGDPGRR